MPYKICFKQLGRAVGVAALLWAVDPVMAETPATEVGAEHQHQPDSTAWIGMYNGSTPCADCVGVKTTLALNKNNTYILLTQYLGKSEREYVEKGKIVWTDPHNLQLTSKDGKVSHRYLLGDNSLTQLDEQGNRITGKQAERYILRRYDISANPPSHSSH